MIDGREILLSAVFVADTVVVLTLPLETREGYVVHSRTRGVLHPLTEALCGTTYLGKSDDAESEVRRLFWRRTSGDFRYFGFIT